MRSIFNYLPIDQLSFPARKDLVYLSGISTVWLLIILWQGFQQSAGIKILYSLSLCATPVYLMALLLPPPKPKTQKLHHPPTNRNKEKKSATSITQGSWIMFCTFFIFSMLSSQSWMMLLSFTVLLAGNMYNAIIIGKWRKMKVFFRKVYLSNGIIPYLLSVFTVGITFSLTVFLDHYSPAFLHYQWQPFTDFKGSATMLPITAALKTGGMALIIATVLLILAVLPYLAYEEEKLFRYQRTTAGQIIRGALIFGPIHVISGIPLYAGIALMSTGLLFSLFYRHHFRKMLTKNPLSPKRVSFQALFPVTALHTVHNSLIFTAFFTIYMLK